MSAVIKTRRFKKLSVSTPALWVVLGLAATFFLVRYGQEVLMEHDLNSRIAVQQRSNERLSEETARLEAALKYYQSDKYVEQRAREDLNLRRADEEVLIPIRESGEQAQGTDSTAQADSELPAGSATAPAETPNWQRWFDLFSPFASSP